jgi:transposase
MYVARVPNRNSPPAILLRESYREGGKVKTRTLANLTAWSEPRIAALKRILKGEELVGTDEAFQITRSLPHGHVAAVRGTLRKIGLHKMLGVRRSRQRDLVEAMIVARILDASSKLATCQGLVDETATSSLGKELGVEDTSTTELYEALDWLLSRQPAIEKKLAAAHLMEGGTALYDLSAAQFEGRTCPLAKRGHPRGFKRGMLQVNFGLLCAPEGQPVSISVYPGNTGDPATVRDQVERIQGDFGLDSVVLVGDRGMLTAKRIREDLKPNDMMWLTSMRAPQVRKLLEAEAFQMSIFDEQNLAEISHDSVPGERLVVCKNPLLAENRERKRNEMLNALETQLLKIQAATQRKNRPLKGKDRIGVRLGKTLKRSKMGKHFDFTIEDDSFSYTRSQERIDKEAALDGIYVIRTNVPDNQLTTEQVVSRYKDLQHVERAFRTMKTVDLHVRPIYHRDSDRVRAHIFLCMLAYYVEWHMRQALLPVLFDDHDREAAAKKPSSVVAPKQRSDAALNKAKSKRTHDGWPVLSFRKTLQNLATITQNQVVAPVAKLEYTKLSQPTDYQNHLLTLLGVKL